MPRPSDARWGRIPGAAPPLRASAPLVWWALTAVVLVVVSVTVVRGPGPLDDPAQGDQRPGFLVDPDEAREVGGLDLPGSPVGRRPVVLIFDRGPPRREALTDFVDGVPRSAAVVLSTAGAGAAQALPERVRQAGDLRGRLADAIGMPRPKDAGPPIGYAVIDAEARVRYATLDPRYVEHGFEIEILAGALR